MNRSCKRILSVVFVMLAMLVLCRLSPAEAQVRTDKTSYKHGEPVKVLFSHATGSDADWVCIVPADSPDTEGGDYKYLPRGKEQGELVFTPPAPGKYQVRAYYNYNRNGYLVTARHSFTVTADAEYDKKIAAQMERALNHANPIENGVPAGKGLVYLFREPWNYYLGGADSVPLKSGNKAVISLSASGYYPYMVAAGEVTFRTGYPDKPEDYPLHCGTTVHVKPGHVYYVKVRVAYVGAVCQLITTPYQEAADFIKNNGLELMKAD